MSNICVLPFISHISAAAFNFSLLYFCLLCFFQICCGRNNSYSVFISFSAASYSLYFPSLPHTLTRRPNENTVEINKKEQTTETRDGRIHNQQKSNEIFLLMLFTSFHLSVISSRHHRWALSAFVWTTRRKWESKLSSLRLIFPPHHCFYVMRWWGCFCVRQEVSQGRWTA